MDSIHIKICKSKRAQCFSKGSDVPHPCGSYSGGSSETYGEHGRQSATPPVEPPPNLYLLSSLLLSALMFVGCQPESTPPAEAATHNIEETVSSAEEGSANAQWELGNCYAKGTGVEQDYAIAAEWYRRAAEQGYAAAQASLGELYEAGQGVEQDDAQAATWYRKAAELGHVKGQYNLAVLYTVGQGVDANATEAVKWYRLAAQQGDVYAQYNLGMRYFLGNGVPPDVVEAYKWLTLAANQKLTDAAMARDKVERSMTREQLAEGRSRVAKFTPRTNAPSADPSASRH